MKRFLTLLLAAVLVFSLASLVACDNGQQGGEQTTEEQTTPAPETQTPEDTTEEPGEDEPSDLENAAEYVRQLYKDTTVTASDYTLVTTVKIGGVSYSVAWSVNTDKITVSEVDDKGNVTIDVPDEAYEEIAYVLTATVSDAEGNTCVKEFNRTVPQFAVTSWADYMAAKEGDSVIIQGVVVAINSKAAGNSRNHLFIMDESVQGGYYSYQMDADPVADLGIEIGMTVRVTGPVTPYNGMQEIKGGIATVLSTEIKSFEAIDITDKWVQGTNFNEFVALPVVIKGVTIGGQDLEKDTSQYLYFELNGVQGYVRTYVTDFPTTLKASDKATIDAAHGAKLGYIADVTGILITYSGTPYLIPTSVDCFYNCSLPERSDAEKVAFEKDSLSLAGTISKGGEMDLPVSAVYGEVTVSWASDSELAVVNGNKLNVTLPGATTTIKLTATLTCGEITETKEFEVKVLAAVISDLSIADAIAKGDAMDHNTVTVEKYYITGTVTEIVNTTYGNLYIEDDQGNRLYVYGTWSADGSQRFDAMETQPVVGDVIKVLSVVGNYNGAQLKNAWIISMNASDEDEYEPKLSISDALAMGEAMEHNTVTDEKYYITGTVTEIKNTTYGNLYIEDAQGNRLYVYGTWNADGSQRFDAMESQPEVGDVITVYSVVGNYNGAQLKNAWIIDANASEGGNGEGGDNNDAPTEGVSTIATILAGENGDYVAEGTVVGVTGRSALISDGTGMILVYVGSDPGCSVGDKVTVSGTTSVYGGAKQFGQGSTVTVKTGGTVTHPAPAAPSAAELDAYATASDIKPVYVKVTGELVVSGNYYNFNIDGATIIGSLSYPAGDIKTALDAQNGNTIEVEGYIIGTASSGKYLTILVVDINA